jgi:hypothetical protein
MKYKPLLKFILMKKKVFYFFAVFFSFFILLFSSCVNNDFDLGDGLDTNATFGNGIQLPVGDIQKISVYDELLKVYDQLTVGADDVVCVEYDGTFPIEFPKFDLAEIKGVDLSPNIPLSGNTQLSQIAGNELLLLADDIEPVIDEPKLDADEFAFDPKEIGFKTLTMDAEFKFTGLSISPQNNNVQIVVTLDIPANYNTDGEAKIEKTFAFNDVVVDGKYHLLEEIKINSYTFGGDGNLKYSVVVKKGNAVLTASNPKFYFRLQAKNPKPDLSYLECTLDGSKTFEGEISFSDLQSSFSESDVLRFKNPSLSLDLKTNLSANFDLGIDLSKGNLSTFMEGSFAPAGADLQKVLTPKDQEKFNEIVSSPFQNSLAYTVNMIFKKDEVARLAPKDQFEFSADYLFRIPFDFNELNFSMNDTIMDIFSEDTYDQIFSHADDITIVADLINTIGGGDIKTDITAVMLDSTGREIPGLIDNTNHQENALSITINNNEEAIKKARHLAFAFRLHGSGVIKASESIELNNLRLVSKKGIRYEL